MVELAVARLDAQAAPCGHPGLHFADSESSILPASPTSFCEFLTCDYGCQNGGVGDRFVVYVELEGMSSEEALRVANKIDELLGVEAGEGKFDITAEQRDEDGKNPTDPMWPGWTDEAAAHYRRYADD